MQVLLLSRSMKGLRQVGVGYPLSGRHSERPKRQRLTEREGIGPPGGLCKQDGSTVDLVNVPCHHRAARSKMARERVSGALCEFDVG